MTKLDRSHIWVLFSILIVAVSLAVLALLPPANAATAQDANRVVLPKVAIPLTKCEGIDACSGMDPSQVGDGSCNGDFACTHYVPYTGTIAAGSCNGGNACQNTAGSIGAGSCNNQFACYVAAGSIGNNSCNTTDTACQAGGTFPILDCQFNNVVLAACIFPSAYLPLIQR